VGGSWAKDKEKESWAAAGGMKELSYEEGKKLGGGRRWNGTHWFDPTVILISLDGVRYVHSHGHLSFPSRGPFTYFPFSVVLILHSASFRADYLERGFTPHLLSVSQKGMVRRVFLPLFPLLSD
jgi:hypothetical protein